MAMSVKKIRQTFSEALDKVQDREKSVYEIRAALCAAEQDKDYVVTTMRRLNSALEGHGVEVIYPDSGDFDPIAYFVNMGETYAVTFVYDVRKRRVIATSWGDWYERTPEYRRASPCKRRACE